MESLVNPINSIKYTKVELPSGICPAFVHTKHTFFQYNYVELIYSILYFRKIHIRNTGKLPWLVWFSGLNELQCPVNLKVAGSIPSRGTCLGCRPGPQVGACERQLTPYLSHTSLFLSLSFSFLSPLSKNK